MATKSLTVFRLSSFAHHAKSLFSKSQISRGKNLRPLLYRCIYEKAELKVTQHKMTKTEGEPLVGPVIDTNVDDAEHSKPAASDGAVVDKASLYPFRKARKVAVMVSFCGKNYLGMQRNPGFPTIEEELLKAFLSAEVISQQWFDNPQEMFFQRASRTDKGVSAMRMIISLKMLYNETNVQETVSKINSFLPSGTVVVNDIKRVTKNFNCKNACDARTYKYLMPTYALSRVSELPLPWHDEKEASEGRETKEDEDTGGCPQGPHLGKEMSEEKKAHMDKEIEAFKEHETYRASSQVLEETNRLLAMYVGSHFYHNFTSGKLPLEPSSNRYMMHFKVIKTFVADNGLEMALLEVKGQSFMLHQIRKMIGLVIAIMRGYTDESVLELSWGTQRVDVPRAPGLGLMLDEVHYESYNRRFGSSDMHQALEWSSTKDQVDKFMEDNVFADIIKTEAEDHSMLKWLQTLGLHSFEARSFENMTTPQRVENIMEAKKRSQNVASNSEAKQPKIETA